MILPQEYRLISSPLDLSRMREPHYGKLEEELPQGWYEVSFTLSSHSHVETSIALRLHFKEGNGDKEIPLKADVQRHIRAVINIQEGLLSWSLTRHRDDDQEEIHLLKLSMTRYPSYLLVGFATYRFLRACVVQKGKPLTHVPLKKRLQLVKSLVSPKKKGNTVSARRGFYTGKRSYEEWININEGDVLKESYAVQECPYKPLISLFLPVKNISGVDLDRTIASLRSQFHPHWELFLISEDDIQNELKAAYEEFKGISVASLADPAEGLNNALRKAEGEFCVIIGEGDVLAPHALMEMVVALNTNPDLDFIYSDHDYINEKGVRCNPAFKPQWAPDSFYAFNYIKNLALMRVSEVRKNVGWRNGFGEATTYEFLLRYLDPLKNTRIARLPKVLYHEKSRPNSPPESPERSGIQALEAFFKEKEERVVVTPVPNMPQESFKVSYEIPKAPPLVSIIIPTKDALEFLKPCVGAVLEKTAYRAFEIIIIDNNSSHPETLKYLQQIESKQVRVLKDTTSPFNYSFINNRAAQEAKGELLCFMNNDVEVMNAHWLAEMVSHAYRPEIGCVGGKLFYQDETIQHAGVILGLGGYAGHAHRGAEQDSLNHHGTLHLVQNYSAVTAALLMVRKGIFNDVSGFNEEDLKVAYNDVDLCIKVREAGYRNLYTPYAEAFHYESKSRGADRLSEEKRVRLEKEKEFLLKQWDHHIEDDLYYSPNLTRPGEDFSLRFE